MKNLQQLIKNNKLNYVNADINVENFPYNGLHGPVDIIHFNKTISKNQVLKKLDDEGYRPATLYEVLTWAEKKWNGEDIVVALGSVWQSLGGRRDCPYLYRYGSERNLYLGWFDGDFDGICRFGAVRKSFDARTLSASSSLVLPATKMGRWAKRVIRQSERIGKDIQKLREIIDQEP